MVSFQVHYLGPPAPPCEVERNKTAKLIGCIKDQASQDNRDPELESILKLTKSMFKAPVALVALFESKRVYSEWGLCTALLAAKA
jgi:hypothetical protein